MRKPLVEDKYIGNPSQGMGAPPARFSREAAPGDPWDASNEPDAFSPLEMIQPDAEDVSAEDNAMLDEWLGQRAARPGTVDASHIAPLRGRVVDGSKIAPMREPGEPGEAPHPAAAEASEGFEGSLDPRSLDYIPAFADNLVAEARAKQRGRR